MSQQNLQQMQSFHKADSAFYRGFISYRSAYRKALIIHFIEIVMLSIVLPIDLTILTPGEKVIAALWIAIADAVVSFLIKLYVYYIQFIKEPVILFCLLAADTNHATNDPVTDTQTIEACTNEEILHFATGAPVQGTPQQYMAIYANLACVEIEKASQYRLPQTNVCSKIYSFLSFGAMITVIVLLATSRNANPTEITILIVFLVLQAYLKLRIIVILAFMVLSPIICVILVCYICCCRPREAANFKLDLKAKPAQTADIVRSGGECAICLMNFNASEPIYELKCSDKHIFHQGCLDNWSKVKPTCPVCRAHLPIIPLSELQADPNHQ